MTLTEKYAFLIPVYNHGKEIIDVLKQLHNYNLSYIIVDDGSNQSTKEQLHKLCQNYHGIELITLPHNQGKGGAIIAGINYAFMQGYSHVFQVDADGQHDTSICEKFISTSQQFPHAVICGEPVYDETVPTSRLKGRKFGNTWAKIVTWSSDIHDAMCGFRIYPVDFTHKIISHAKLLDKRMGFDLEILIRLKWENINLIYLPVGITYPQNGISHFHVVKDNFRISIMFTRAFLCMLVKIPVFLAKKITKQKRHI